MPLCRTDLLSMLHLGGQNTLGACLSPICGARPMSIRTFVLLCAATLLPLLAVGCDALVDRPALTIDFGSAYNVRFGENVTEASGVVRSTPYTDALGTLHVAVEFNGGCTNHFFQIDHLLAESTATVWLVHSANGDPCEAVTTQEVSLRLPRTVLDKETILLVSPSGRDEPVTRYDAVDGGP